MPTMTMRKLRWPGVAQCLEKIARFDTSRLQIVKTAELGGDGQDSSFEQAFSNLAHAYMRDKAPSLLDHEMGFQLLDRNQENTKAIGIFGFKVGSHLLYAPVFFLKGDLKGHELLYIKNQDMFVPLDEGWINYILNRKPNVLGEDIHRNSAQLGIQQPDLNRLSKSPWKYASWIQSTMPKIAATVLTDVGAEIDAWGRELNLPDFCKTASLSQLEVLVKTCQKYPTFAAEIERHHGSLDFISEGIKLAATRPKAASVLDPASRRRFVPTTGSVLDVPRPQHPLKTGALKIIEYDATQETDLPEEITDEDREKLLTDAVLIKDHRKGEEVSVPYNIQVEQKLTNPTETGLYMVLVKPGGFEKCFVGMFPHGPHGRAPFATIVRLEGEDKKAWCNAHPTAIWVASKIEGKEYDDWFDSLKTAESVPVSTGYSNRKRQILIGPGHNTNCTLPFFARTELGNERGGTVYEVDFATYCDINRAAGSGPGGRHSYSDSFDAADYSRWDDGERVHLNGKQGTKLRSNRGDLWVPEGYKILSVDPAVSDKEDDKGDCCSPCSTSDPPPLRPGNLMDAQLAVMTKVGEVRLRADTLGVTINDQRFSKVAGLVQLVAVHGLREDVSREILKRAAAKPAATGAYVFHIKYANPYQSDPYLTGSGPTAPSEPTQQGSDNPMGFAGPTTGPQEYSMRVPGMGPTTDPSIYNPKNVPEPMDNGSVNRAMQSGQKEVFDTSVIGSMLKAVRDDTMVDRYLSDLVKAMDRVGRIMFHFYWHGDKFADRYGKSDMPELEDTLRNTFEMLGELVLFLKQKTIEPYPEEDATSLNLQDSSSV